MKIGIVAGETSGDLLGAEVVAALKARVPDAKFIGLGGPAMIAQGVESLADMDKISIMGVMAAIKGLVDILSIRRTIRKAMLDWRPDVFIGVDVPDFNLSLEKQLKDAGIPTVHLVSPTVWAWRGHRIHRIRRAVDLMLTLFPFERDYYQKQKMPVAFVGHPLAQQVANWQPSTRLLKTLGLDDIAKDSKKKLVALLPGSRRSEVSRLAPIMLATAKGLQRSRRDLRFIVPAANQTLFDDLKQRIKEADVDLCLIHGHSRDVLSLCDVAVLASGTAALEAALFAKPMIVMYKVAKLEQWYAMRTMTVDRFSMPNHLVSPPPVPELIQEDANQERLSHELCRLLDDAQVYREMQNSLAGIAPQLSVDTGALSAAAILDLLDADGGSR